MNKIFVAAAAVFSLSLHAYEVKVATITSNIDRDTTEFFIETVADGSIDGLHIVTKNPRGQVTAENRATVEEVVASGFVMLREGNRDVTILRVEDFTPEAGGKVVVDYLFSGVNNSRRKLHLGIKKTDGDFFLHTVTGASATQLRVFGNWVPLLGLVGIANVRVMDRWWGSTDF